MCQSHACGSHPVESLAARQGSGWLPCILALSLALALQQEARQAPKTAPRWKSRPQVGRAVQGDVMSGSIATFLGWAHGYLEATGKTPGDIPPAVLAAYGGCSVARRASKKCFAIKKRSMIAVDLLEHLGHSVDELFEAQS